MNDTPATIYFRAAGRSLDAFRATATRIEYARASLLAWQARFGAIAVAHSGSLRFDGDPPSPWVPVRGDNPRRWCTPTRRTKEGKALDSERQKLPKWPTNEDLAEAMGLSVVHRIVSMSCLRTYGVAGQNVGDEVFLSVYANDDGTPSLVPPDAERVPPSTYHLACEAAGVPPF